MPDNLNIALIGIAVGAAIGIPFAVLLPKLRPDWRTRYGKTRSWVVGLIVLVVCAVMSAGHFVEGRPYLGCIFAAFAALVFFVLLIAGVRLLFRRAGTNE